MAYSVTDVKSRGNGGISLDGVALAKRRFDLYVGFRRDYRLSAYKPPNSAKAR
jgi:hypothetical protein